MCKVPGKVSLVTGGSRGIGSAIVEKLAKNGSNVAFTYLSSPEKAQELISKLEIYPVKIRAYASDASNHQASKDLITQVVADFGGLDILVNNAGVVTKGLLQMTTMKQLKDVFQINFFAQVQITQGVSKLMMRQKTGVIINMASIGGLDAFPAYTSYGCSKSALIYFTKTMSQELSPYHIRVNAVAPSLTDTAMSNQMGEEANAEIMRRTAIKSLVSVDDVAKLVLFLSSDDSSFINGQIIRVDGGM